jgi:glycosidase
MQPTPPDWVRDAVFYQIFPDRFASSARVPKPSNLEPWDASPTRRGFKGGDLLGIAERLDYLEDLGINALYLNPIFRSAANHRYHTHDYYQIDPLLGGDAAFRTLLDRAHAHGIRVVLDGVFNHTGRGFYQFNHIAENGPKSPYVDWFLIRDFPLRAYEEDRPPNYAAWWDNRELPKLNTGNAEVREFVMEVAEYWLNQGIDGWRLDVPLDIEAEGFWQEFRRRVKAINPDAYILAEIWDNAVEWLAGDCFDAAMNYPFSRACYGFFGGELLDDSVRPGGFPVKALEGEAFAIAIRQGLDLYDWDVVLSQYNLLGSHDVPRFLTMVGGDERRLRLATLFQMVFPGPPSIYYGDEISMEGGADPDCRRAFDWDAEAWDDCIRADVKRFVALRHQHSALRRGAYAELLATATSYALVRWDEAQVIVAIFNVASEPTRVTVSLPEDLVGVVGCSGPGFRDAWSGEPQVFRDGEVAVQLPSMDGRVLIHQRS